MAFVHLAEILPKGISNGDCEARYFYAINDKVSIIGTGGTIMDGILPLWKERGMTSHDCVFKLRKILHTKKLVMVVR